jgi:FixJ family two-component response regulator
MVTGTIMIVDDEPEVTAALRAFVESETAFGVADFCAPEPALEALPGLRPCVILADFAMPAMDGITFLIRARECCPLASRILLTGPADREQAIRAIHDAGLYHFLEKPWCRDQLRFVLRNGAERHSLLADLDAHAAALEESNHALYALRQRLVHAFL